MLHRGKSTRYPTRYIDWKETAGKLGYNCSSYRLGTSYHGGGDFVDNCSSASHLASILRRVMQASPFGLAGLLGFVVSELANPKELSPLDTSGPASQPA